MAEPPSQGELFEAPAGSDVVPINARCCLRTAYDHRVVSVAGVPVAHYAVGDRMAEAQAMVNLVEQGWAESKAGPIRTTWPVPSGAPRGRCADISVAWRTAGWRHSAVAPGTPEAARRKLSRLAAAGRAIEFGRALARRRLATHGNALGLLYVDGHGARYRACSA